MSLKLKEFYIIYLFFFLYFLIGLYITPDYSISPDETLHRENGFIHLKYIAKLFNQDLDLQKYFKSIPNLEDDWRKTYGVIFDLPFTIYEVFYKNNNIDIFLLKHYGNFIIFFISSIYFYFLLFERFGNKLTSLIGVLILVTSPRIFSHSFYNSKDILFLSLIIIAVYYSLKLLKNFSYKSLFISALFCALASNIRIIGLFLPLLNFFFYYFNVNKKKYITTFNFITNYSIIFFLIYYAITPYLWLKPYSNFLVILKESTNYPTWWDFKILYFGQYLNSENLPWHYFFSWFFLTTPFFYFLLIVIGLSFYSYKFFSTFIKINFNNIFLWGNNNEMVNLYMLLCFFIPIYFVVCLNSTLYNGWRHLFFIYPFTIYFGIFVTHYLKSTNIYLYKIIIFIIIVQTFWNVFFIFYAHPVQNIYFNFISNKFVQNKFPVDYWGLGNEHTLIKILKDNPGRKIIVSTSSYTDLNKLRFFNKENLPLDNLVLKGTSKIDKDVSDFIFTNYYYNVDPSKTQKYKIPSNFFSYYKLVIDGIVVNEIFKKVE